MSSAARPPALAHLDGLIALGFAETALETLLAFSRAGGSALASQVIEATGLLPMAALRQLHQLERAGYVYAGTEQRSRPRLTIWHLDSSRVRADLLELADATAPPPASC